MQTLSRHAIRIATLAGLAAFVFFTGIFGRSGGDNTFSLFSVPIGTPVAHADDPHFDSGCPCSDGGCCT